MQTACNKMSEVYKPDYIVLLHDNVSVGIPYFSISNVTL